ncbi:MAG TPA: hypothetical protein VMN37_02490 [Gemmatimonadales bacterium]|nr:hypothetical protein [Gemmatimonadales bacterium]
MAYRRALKAGLELAGVTGLNGSELLRLEIERFAKSVVLHEEAARHWADMLNSARPGRAGGRPSGGSSARPGASDWPT